MVWSSSVTKQCMNYRCWEGMFANHPDKFIPESTEFLNTVQEAASKVIWNYNKWIPKLFKVLMMMTTMTIVTTAAATTTGVMVVVVVEVVAVEAAAAILLWLVFFFHYFKYCESE